MIVQMTFLFTASFIIMLQS